MKANKTINTRAAVTVDGILVEISESLSIDSNTTDDIITSLKKNSILSNLTAINSIVGDLKEWY